MSATGEPYREAARRIDGFYDTDNLSGAWEGASQPFLVARVATAVLFTDHHGHVLLVRGPHMTSWSLPGRHLRHHEVPSNVRVDVVPEQLGICPSVGEMLVVDWAPDPDDGFPSADKVMFVFDGGTLGAEWIARIEPDPAHVAEFAFHDPAALGAVLDPPLVRRVTAALAARAGGTRRYLVLGVG